MLVLTGAVLPMNVAPQAPQLAITNVNVVIETRDLEWRARKLKPARYEAPSYCTT
jgi:hypothetical protein